MKKITIKPTDGMNMSQMQRDIWDKIYTAIALSETEISELTVNVAIGAMMGDFHEYVMEARTDEEIEHIKQNPREIYTIGMIAGININVDPMMQWSDTRVLAEGLEMTIDIDPSQIV